MTELDLTKCYVCGSKFAEGEDPNAITIEDDEGYPQPAMVCDECIVGYKTRTDEKLFEAGYDDFDDPRQYCAYCGARYMGGYCWASPDGFHAYDD